VNVQPDRFRRGAERAAVPSLPKTRRRLRNSRASPAARAAVHARTVLAETPPCFRSLGALQGMAVHDAGPRRRVGSAM